MPHLDEATLNEYLDDSLETATKEEVARHLRICDECQARLVELQHIFTALAAVDDVPISNDISTQIITQLNYEVGARRLPDGLYLALAIQIGLIAVLFLVLWPNTQTYIPEISQPLLDGWFALSAAWTSAQPAELLNALATEFYLAAESARPPQLLSIDQWLWLVGLALIAWLAGNGLLLRNRNNR